MTEQGTRPKHPLETALLAVCLATYQCHTSRQQQRRSWPLWKGLHCHQIWMRRAAKGMRSVSGSTAGPNRDCHAAQTPRAIHIDQFMNQPATPIHGHSSFTLQEGLPKDAAIQRGVRLGGLGALQPVKGRGALEQGSHGCSVSHDCSTWAITAAPGQQHLLRYMTNSHTRTGSPPCAACPPRGLPGNCTHPLSMPFQK